MPSTQLWNYQRARNNTLRVVVVAKNKLNLNDLSTKFLKFMPTTQEILGNLCEFPHRGSTTEYERKTAHKIQEWLKSFGIPADLQEFRSPATFSWELIGIASLLALGVALGPYLPIPGTFIAVLGAWFFTRHFIGEATPFSKLVRKRPSQNVIGTIKSEDTQKKTVVLMAHYDTSRAALIWSPAMVKNFRQSFLINATLAYAAIPLTYLGTEWGSFLWYKIVSIVLAVYFLFQIILFIQRETVHTHVPGANDNGSGTTAILKLAEHYVTNPLKSTRIIIAATGCEEAGMHGAEAFLEQYEDDLDPDNTYFLNFDNVGAANLHYCVGEGMLFFWAYDQGLVDLAEAHTKNAPFQNIRSHRYQVAYFDTLPVVKKGYKCLTFIGLQDDKSIPNWHWYSDTIENIEWETLGQSIDFGKALITAIDNGGVVQ